MAAESDGGDRAADDADTRPLVSIVMPAYQPRLDWFEEALASLLCEPIPIEIIVVDDGSATPIELPIDDERIGIVRTDRVGPYRARDIGVECARGRFIRFFDADDVSVEGSTGRLLAVLGEQSDRIAYGATVMCDEQLKPTRLLDETVEGDAVEECLMGRFDAYHVSMLFPVDCVRDAGPWEAGFTVSGDWDFVLRAIEVLPVVYLDDVVTMYRRSATSITGQVKRQTGIDARYRIVERFARRHPDRRSLIRRATAATHLAQASAQADAGRRWRARLTRGRAASIAPDLVLQRWRAGRPRSLPVAP